MGATSAVKLQTGPATAASKAPPLSMRRSDEQKAPIGSAVNPRSSIGFYTIKEQRQVRVRLAAVAESNRPARTTSRKRAAASEMSGICAMPDSPVAVNRGTGRTAVGPWCGAFEQSTSAADHEPPSRTLFMDRAGSAHRSLDGSVRAARGRHASPQGPSMDCTLALTGAADPASATRRAELRDHSREVALAASKGSPKGSIEARWAPRSGGNSARRRAGHHIFQPSGRFF